jgi:hypothetical protein
MPNHVYALLYFSGNGAMGDIKIHVNDILSSIIPGSPYSEGPVVKTPGGQKKFRYLDYYFKNKSTYKLPA